MCMYYNYIYCTSINILQKPISMIKHDYNIFSKYISKIIILKDNT